MSVCIGYVLGCCTNVPLNLGRDRLATFGHASTHSEAIRCGHRLRLALVEGEYLAEPHVLGRNCRGKTLLRAYQLSGPAGTRRAISWRLFDLDRIQHAVESGERFDNPRPGYKPNDTSMKGGIIESV
jgi:hypothetical protein